MNGPGSVSLGLVLKLRTETAIRGESVFFDVVLKNGGVRPLPNLMTLEAANESLRLRALTADEKRKVEAASGSLMPAPNLGKRGSGVSYLERDGFHQHGSEEPKRMTLEPGADLTEQGDLLRWLGELSAGTYEITAEYTAPTATVVSNPVKLTIEPAKPVSLTRCHPADCPGDTALSAAWVHQGAEGATVFYQQVSCRLPENPWLGARAVMLKSVGELAVAGLTSPQAAKGHVLWVEKNQLFLGLVDIKSGKAVAGLTKAVPGASFLRSPRSMPDGSVCVPMTDAKRAAVTLLRVEATGAATSRNLDLGATVPFDAHFCCWEGSSKLRFFWAAAGGRQVHQAVVFLDDPAAPPTVAQAYLSNDPVEWLHPFFDRTAGIASRPVFENETPPDDRKMGSPPDPRVWTWSIARKQNVLNATLVNVSYMLSSLEGSFDLKEQPDLRVIDTALIGKKNVCILLAAPDGTIWFAETARQTLTPIVEIIGKPLKLIQQPGLYSATSGVLPYIHVRYLDPVAGRIASAKLEPYDPPKDAGPDRR